MSKTIKESFEEFETELKRLKENDNVDVTELNNIIRNSPLFSVNIKKVKYGILGWDVYLYIKTSCLDDDDLEFFSNFNEIRITDNPDQNSDFILKCNLNPKPQYEDNCSCNYEEDENECECNDEIEESLLAKVIEIIGNKEYEQYYNNPLSISPHLGVNCFDSVDEDEIKNPVITATDYTSDGLINKCTIKFTNGTIMRTLSPEEQEFLDNREEIQEALNKLNRLL
ncbi:hypothetical protein [Methanobrevibacter sp. DSM 116169]|uniref:hypothetical protein n=1 Tax=Methanobrevibacter sp. DSM 116169 TaxID=3242727 RepID=UPI0038FC9A78